MAIGVLENVGRNTIQRLTIVGRFETLIADERFKLDQIDTILQLFLLVARIDVDEDAAQLGSGVLREQPFVRVDSPNAHSMASTAANRVQCLGQSVDLHGKREIKQQYSNKTGNTYILIELHISLGYLLMVQHEDSPVGHFSCSSLQHLPNGHGTVSGWWLPSGHTKLVAYSLLVVEVSASLIHQTFPMERAAEEHKFAGGQHS